MASKKDEDMRDFQKFMNKVNTLDAIVKGMASEDTEEQAKAIAKADRQIKKNDPNKNIGFSRTVINKKAFEDDKPSPLDGFEGPQTDQNAFMKAMEADAQQRYEARCKRHAKANIAKERGNKLFAEGEFSQALRCYNQAIDIAKDMPSLYTNRAACFMKMRKFDRVIDDCDIAVRVDEKWVKSHYLKSRALLNMGKFARAKKYARKMSETDPSKTNLADKLLDEIEQSRVASKQESEARRLLEEEDGGAGDGGDLKEAKQVDEVIGKLRGYERKYDDNVDIVYYTGGIVMLTQLLKDENSRTLFRLQGGFELVLSELKLVHQVMTDVKMCVEDKQLDLMVAVIRLLREACHQLNENLKYLFTSPLTSKMLFELMDRSIDDEVRCEIVSFMYQCSLLQDNRHILYKSLDICRIGKYLLESSLTLGDDQQPISSFHNFTLDDKFLRLLNDDHPARDECLKLASKILDKGKAKSSAVIKTTCIKSLINMCENNQHLAKRLATNDENIVLGKSIRSLIIGLGESSEESSQVLLESCLNLFYLLTRNGLLSSAKDHVLFHHLSALLFKTTKLQLETIKLMSLMCEKFDHIVTTLKEKTDLLKDIFTIALKNEKSGLRTFALKIICIVSKNHVETLSFIPRLDKKYKTMREILASRKPGSVAVDQSHVALLLGNMSRVSKFVSVMGDDDEMCSEVMRNLLVLCRDLGDKSSRVNCTLCLAKLAKAHPRFLHHLRLNDGINILSRQDPSELK